MYHKCTESFLRETKYHARKFLYYNEVEKEKVWLKVIVYSSKKQIEAF